MHGEVERRGAMVTEVETGCRALCYFFFQAEDGIRDYKVTGVQTCALPIYVDAVLLLGLPANFTDGAARLLLRVLLRAVRAAVAGRADPPVRAGRETGRFHAPVLVRRKVPTDRPVHPGIDRIGG